MQRNVWYVVCITLTILVVILYFVSSVIIKNIELEPYDADIVIIGLGTAGSIMARRLHDNLPNHKIVVLERGQNRRNDSNVYNVSNGSIAAYDPLYSTLLKSDNDNVQVTVASMYGGCSSHNFGLTVHSSPQYYDSEWQKTIGLSYTTVLPYFARVEKYSGFSQNPSVRGTDGLIKVYQLPTSLDVASKAVPLIKQSFANGFIEGISNISKSVNTLANIGPLRASNKFSSIMLKAIHKLKGVPTVEDYNTDITVCSSATQQLFIDQVSGLRSSADVAYLPSTYIDMNSVGESKSQCGNLQIVPNATVDTFSTGCVNWFGSDGKLKTTRLKRNGRVILCGGGIYSPFLLKKSGFTNPEIGKNLTTHYGCTLIVSVDATSDEDFNFAAGPLTFVPRECNSNTRDWQVICGGGALLNKKLLTSIGIDSDLEMRKNPNLRYFVMLGWILKPRTRGTISVADRMTPDIKLKMFGDGTLYDKNSDLSNIVDLMIFMYSIVNEMKQCYPSIASVYPPENVFAQNDKNILSKYAKDGVSMTDHYSSGCAIGKVISSSDFSLISDSARSSNVHVVDASVFPVIPDGNTEFPVCVIAEVAADRITNAIRATTKS